MARLQSNTTKKTENTFKLRAVWQFPMESTYKGLHFQTPDKLVKFTSGSILVDFINYKQYVAEVLPECSVELSTSFIDIVTLKEGSYRIGYFDGENRVNDSVLSSLSPMEAMSMFNYYVVDESINTIKDLVTTYKDRLYSDVQK